MAAQVDGAPIAQVSANSNCELGLGDKPDNGVMLREEAPLSIGVGQGASLAMRWEQSIRVRAIAPMAAAGNWLHIGWHMCTSVCGAPLLSLPYAVALLGWPAGILTLIIGCLTTLWTSVITADLCEWDGTRHIRWRDLAESVFGRFWGKAIIWPCQWTNLIGSIIAGFILSGLTMQGIYQLHTPGGEDFKLWHFILIMGALAIVASQLPTTHSLRWINCLAMMITFSFSIMAIVISLYQGIKYDMPKDYGVHGSNIDKAFGALNGIAITSFAFGNTIVPEIAATAKAPYKSTMRGGIGIVYVLLASTYFPVALTGYWAYGFGLVANGGSFLPTFFGSVGGPTWLIYLCLASTLGNAFMGVPLYLSSVNEFVESKVYTRSVGVWGVRNWAIRTAWRTSFLCLLIFIACLIPFFGDFLALIGALGMTPISFVYPLALALKVGYLKSWKSKALAIFLMSLYTLVGIGGTISSVRSIVVDASNYAAFANLGVAKTT